MSFWSKVKHTVGDVLKVGAPIAALAIPGVGPLAAAGIAAGGRAAGSALKGEKVNIGDTLATGAGVGLGKGVVNADAKVGAQGGGSPFDKVKAYIAKNPLDAARIGLAGASTLQSARTASRADKAVQTALDQANRPVAPIDLAALFPQDSPYRKSPRGAY